MKSQRIVVISEDPQTRMELKQVVSVLGYDVLAEASNPEDGLRVVRRIQPDLVLLEPAERAMALLDILSREIPIVVLLNSYEQHLLERVVEAGASGVVFKPFGALELGAVLLVANANFRQTAALQQRINQLEEEFELRKLVDRAKSKVMEISGMSEAEAHHWLQKMCMDKRRSLKRVAEDILKGRLELPRKN